MKVNLRLAFVFLIGIAGCLFSESILAQNLHRKNLHAFSIQSDHGFGRALWARPFQYISLAPSYGYFVGVSDLVGFEGNVGYRFALIQNNVSLFYPLRTGLYNFVEVGANISLATSSKQIHRWVAGLQFSLPVIQPQSLKNLPEPFIKPNLWLNIDYRYQLYKKSYLQVGLGYTLTRLSSYIPPNQNPLNNFEAYINGRFIRVNIQYLYFFGK
jgi:hypothetical protein